MSSEKANTAEYVWGCKPKGHLGQCEECGHMGFENLAFKQCEGNTSILDDYFNVEPDLLGVYAGDYQLCLTLKN